MTHIFTASVELDYLRWMARILKHEWKRLNRSEQRFIVFVDADDEMGACAHDHYTKILMYAPQRG